MNVIVFEDEQVEALFPITTGRPAYAITCAGYRLIDWIERLELLARAVVRPHLTELQQLEHPRLAMARLTTDLPTLLVNARLVPSVRTAEFLRECLRRPAPPRAFRNGEHLVAALYPAGPVEATTRGVRSLRQQVTEEIIPAESTDLPLFHLPHDVIRHNMLTMEDNLNFRIEHGDYREVADGVFAEEDVRLGDYLVTDTSDGPILLDRGVAIGPHAYMAGPVHLGPGVRVNEHAAIKDAVCVGHTSKIGGEVEASVIEAYSNKQHHGFLGHSYLGSWINLGAGTCNSDLKNTYGEVKMEYRGRKALTGMQFVGCIMGDYAKTAINTGIFTGKTIGSCSMLYGFVTTNVPSFVNYARLFGQVTELPPEVMISTQKRMFARRKVEQRECDRQLIRDMYELTRPERQLGDEPLAL